MSLKPEGFKLTHDNSLNLINPTNNNSLHIDGTREIPTISNQFINNPVYFNQSPSSFSNEDPLNRALAIEQLLRLEHLNSEEIDNVQTLISEHSDRFHLSGKPLGVTNATKHFIPTTNKIPIHTK